MTGRGGVLGGKVNSGGCGGKRPYYGKCKMGLNSRCCGKGGGYQVTTQCRQGCGCWHKGRSQPAPQMGYGVYLNRKSSAAYRPGWRVGNKSCRCDISKNIPVLDSSEIIEKKAANTASCVYREPITAYKPVAKSTRCVAFRTKCSCINGCSIVKPRLSYTRINQNWCGVTKSMRKSSTSSAKTALIKHNALNPPPPCSDQ